MSDKKDEIVNDVAEASVVLAPLVLATPVAFELGKKFLRKKKKKFKMKKSFSEKKIEKKKKSEIPKKTSSGFSNISSFSRKVSREKEEKVSSLNAFGRQFNNRIPKQKNHKGKTGLTNQTSDESKPLLPKNGRIKSKIGVGRKYYYVDVPPKKEKKKENENEGKKRRRKPFKDKSGVVYNPDKRSISQKGVLRNTRNENRNRNKIVHRRIDQKTKEKKNIVQKYVCYILVALSIFFFLVIFVGAAVSCTYCGTTINWNNDFAFNSTKVVKNGCIYLQSGSLFLFMCFSVVYSLALFVVLFLCLPKKKGKLDGLKKGDFVSIASVRKLIENELKKKICEIFEFDINVNNMDRYAFELENELVLIVERVEKEIFFSKNEILKLMQDRIFGRVIPTGKKRIIDDPKIKYRRTVEIEEVSQKKRGGFEIKREERIEEIPKSKKKEEEIIEIPILKKKEKGNFKKKRKYEEKYHNIPISINSNEDITEIIPKEKEEETIPRVHSSPKKKESGSNILNPEDINTSMKKVIENEKNYEKEEIDDETHESPDKTKKDERIRVKDEFLKEKKIIKKEVKEKEKSKEVDNKRTEEKGDFEEIIEKKID